MEYIFNKKCNISDLSVQLQHFNFKELKTVGDQTVIVATDPLTEENLLELTTIIENHQPQLPQKIAEDSVEKAIIFAQHLTINFAAENVVMGITQAGKTKEVSDFLADVTRYAQTGSLYEVINELDSLVAAGLPQELEPFVTETRLNTFKNKIIEHLS
jgi:hypothetical protein